jgi:isopenicillin N synthase-like dioxygenase
MPSEINRRYVPIHFRVESDMTLPWPNQAIDIYPEPEIPSTEELEGSQLWPSDADAPGFKLEMLAYTEKMKIVGKAFMRVMGDVLGEQEIFAGLQDDNYWWVIQNARVSSLGWLIMVHRVLRVIGYPPLSEDYDTNKGLSCGAHTDYGCLTFLLADDFPGALQGECRHQKPSRNKFWQWQSRRKTDHGFQQTPYPAL